MTTPSKTPQLIPRHKAICSDNVADHCMKFCTEADVERLELELDRYKRALDVAVEGHKRNIYKAETGTERANDAYDVGINTLARIQEELK